VLDLARSFSRAELERAYLATVADFPVLGCTYREGWLRDRWVRSSAALATSVIVAECDDLEAETRVWLDRPPTEPGARPFRIVRLSSRAGAPSTGAGRCRILVSLLHVAVDGAGVAAVGHVFACHLVGVAPSLEIERRRGVLSALDGLPLRSVPLVARAVLAQLAVPLRQLAAARRERPYPKDRGAPASRRYVVLDEARVRAARAKLGNASVNDLLVGLLAVAAGQRSRRGPVVVTYTMDLRRYASRRRLSTANTSSFLSAVVPRAALSSLARATAAVGAITRRQQRALHGPAYLVIPYLLGGLVPHAALRSVVPVLAPIVVELPLSRGLLLTNVGRVDHGLAALGEDLVGLEIVGPSSWGIDVPIVVAYGFRGAVHLQLFAGPGLGPRALEELEREILDAFSEV
jgi:NRPS condensation-like uncharacterized protein